MAYPIGGDRGDKYLLIEMHYDNPNMETGIYICTYVTSYMKSYHTQPIVHYSIPICSRDVEIILE